MKKKLCFILVLAILFTMASPLYTFASHQGYDNFVPVKDIEKDLSLPDDVKNSWFYPYFKASYNLGILEERLSPTSMQKHDDNVSLSYATYVICKIASIYLDDNFEFPILGTFRYDGNLNKYSKSLGIMYGKEVLEEVEEKQPIYDSLYYNKTTAWATKRDIQILLTRLFKVIDPGEEINSITRIVDVDNSSPDKVNFEGVLQLYNLGIITGDEHGRFNYHQNITSAEFVTIIARVCFPKLRVKISTEDYEKHFENSEVATYNSLSDEYVNEFMQKYGWDKLYDKQEYNPYDIVCFNEVPKMVVAAGLNEIIKDTSEVKATSNEYWFSFFKSMGIIDKNVEYSTAPIGKLHIAKMMAKLSNMYHKIPIGTTKSLDFNYIFDYSFNDINIINNALNLGIIENTNEDINSTFVTKNELNKMLVWYAMQTSSTCPTNKHKTGEARDNIVYDETKWPSNASIYPYIADNAPKEIYEITPKRMEKKESSKNPIEAYDIFKDFYYESDQNISNYFEQILNIDYATIDTDKLIDAINQYCVYDLTIYFDDTNTYMYRGSIDKYVEHVKQNKIKLKGKATPILPIVYSDDGLYYFARTKLEFEVINSDTDQNLLLWDTGITYTGNKFELYIDLPVLPTANSKALRIRNQVCCMSIIAKQLNGVITVSG